MRIGALLDDPADVAEAEAAGLFGVTLTPPPRPGPADTGSIAAAAVAARTRHCRVLVTVLLGTEHPVTLAEEVAVLDHLSGGRVVVVVDPGELDDAAASEDLSLLRACWSGRPVQHVGLRWTVPSGVMAEQLGAAAPQALAVTPVPAQVDLPVWTTRAVSATGAPAVTIATSPEEVDTGAHIAPGTATLSGDLEHDRMLVSAWAAAGATHLLVRVPERRARDRVDRGFFSGYVARYLVPEVAMPGFPRVMAEAALPAVLGGSVA